MRFENKTRLLHTGLEVDQETIRRLPQFLRSSPEYVYRMGGSVYRSILEAWPCEGKRSLVSIDSRVHMLMPGFLPCIGGWHCDDFYRPTGGQPDLPKLSHLPSMQATHHALILGSNVAPTMFACEPIEISNTTLQQSENVYKECHKLIETLKPDTYEAAPGFFITFDSFTFHRCTRAKGSGWRLFVRITESDHYEPMNEIRTQTQVYIVDESAGW